MAETLKISEDADTNYILFDLVRIFTFNHMKVIWIKNVIESSLPHDFNISKWNLLIFGKIHRSVLEFQWKKYRNIQEIKEYSVFDFLCD